MKNNILRVQFDNFPEKPNYSQLTSVLLFGEDSRESAFLLLWALCPARHSCHACFMSTYYVLGSIRSNRTVSTMELTAWQTRARAGLRAIYGFTGDWPWRPFLLHSQLNS